MESSQGKRFVIAGGSGFLGLSLAHYLTSQGASVAILSRRQPKVTGPWEYVLWDGRTVGSWSDSLNSIDGVVNLSGRTVNCIKTPDHKDQILRSRVESTLALGQAMRLVDNPPQVWVQMSTAHIYGDPPEAVCSEGSVFGLGLAPKVAKAWEAAFAESKLASQRTVVLRTSFVIGRNRGAGGGALGTLGMLARIGLGGRIASGTQGMSWIHELDMNRIFERGLNDENMEGAYVASSPNPVSQAEFMRQLRKAVRMPIGFPATEWMVRLGAHWLLRTDPELALYGRYVVSKRLEEEGFLFEHPELCGALKDLLS